MKSPEVRAIELNTKAVEALTKELQKEALVQNRALRFNKPEPVRQGVAEPKVEEPTPQVEDGSLKLPAYLGDGSVIRDLDDIPSNGFGRVDADGINIHIPRHYFTDLTRSILETGDPVGFVIQIYHTGQV